MTISNASAGQSGSAHGSTHLNASAPARPTPGLAWAVRRAILGIAIMTVAVAIGACLLYFTIDPDAEARAEGDMTRKPVAAATAADQAR